MSRILVSNAKNSFMVNVNGGAAQFVLYPFRNPGTGNPSAHQVIIDSSTSDSRTSRDVQMLLDKGQLREAHFTEVCGLSRACVLFVDDKTFHLLFQGDPRAAGLLTPESLREIEPRLFPDASPAEAETPVDPDDGNPDEPEPVDDTQTDENDEAEDTTPAERSDPVESDAEESEASTDDASASPVKSKVSRKKSTRRKPAAKG
jgi:hypothetical protein